MDKNKKYYLIHAKWGTWCSGYIGFVLANNKKEARKKATKILKNGIYKPFDYRVDAVEETAKDKLKKLGYKYSFNNK